MTSVLKWQGDSRRFRGFVLRFHPLHHMSGDWKSYLIGRIYEIVCLSTKCMVSTTSYGRHEHVLLPNVDFAAGA